MCGIPGVPGHQWDYGTCGTPITCTQPIPGTNRTTPVDAFATLIRQHGRWVLKNVWCPQNGTPTPDPAAIRQQAIRLLPHITIGSAWQHTALVNTQTILWANTNPARTLPTVTLLGQQVQLRITLDQADWHFGDTTSTTTSDPGRPYNPTTDPCNTAQCPDYFGHTYTTPGHDTITLQLNWHAQFSLNAGTTWTDIDPDPLTGPTSTRPLHVEQAHSTLTPP